VLVHGSSPDECRILAFRRGRRRHGEQGCCCNANVGSWHLSDAAGTWADVRLSGEPVNADMVATLASDPNRTLSERLSE
jgi:hypothetical protein